MHNDKKIVKVNGYLFECDTDEFGHAVLETCKQIVRDDKYEYGGSKGE